MIAKNLRKFAEAMALQLPLPFGTVLRWATARPGSRTARSIRAARGRAFKLAGRIAAPKRPPVPQWWKDSRRRARQLAERVRALMQGLTYAR